MLYIFSGLPGCGKSTIAKLLSEKLKAVYLRVDTIEQALRNGSAASRDIGPEGYFILYELARDNLKLGLPVVTDSVNDLNLVRDSFRDIAISSGVPFRSYHHSIQSGQSDDISRVLESVEGQPGRKRVGSAISEERKFGIKTHIDDTQEKWASHSRIVCLIQHNGVY